MSSPAYCCCVRFDVWSPDRLKTDVSTREVTATPISPTSATFPGLSALHKISHHSPAALSRQGKLLWCPAQVRVVQRSNDQAERPQFQKLPPLSHLLPAPQPGAPKIHFHSSAQHQEPKQANKGSQEAKRNHPAQPASLTLTRPPELVCYKVTSR